MTQNVPLTDAEKARVARLKRLVIFLGLVMVALFLFLVGTLIYRIGASGERDHPALEISAPIVSADATLVSWQFQDDQVAVEYRLSSGERVLFVRSLTKEGPWQRVPISQPSP